MCGIAGYWGNTGKPDQATLERMTAQIQHRGPDDAGVWVDEDVGIALGHRRLSVIDPSPAGHQPMASASERYVIVYNGEIYNHQELRRELEKLGAAPPWRGHSDTEVMLAAFDHWGIEKTLTRLNGMFAFALWDRKSRSLYLARDRMGEKPLYYGTHGNTFLFGSELKALQAHPAFHGEVNRDALTLFLRHRYVPAPWSIWRNIKKLPPAHYVIVRSENREPGKPIAYWNFSRVAQNGAQAPLPDGPELIDRLETLLRDAVLCRMEADVPLGAFLSGGVDSSVVVALMQAQSSRPVKTFSIGFREKAFDESVHAQEVAAHLGTDHTKLYVTSHDALAILPKLPGIWDEPFSDSSQIPTYLLSALTRRHVTVSLSGDGGDELFGGYKRYLTAIRLWKTGTALPRPLRDGVASLLKTSLTEASFRAFMRTVPRKHRVDPVGDRLPKFGRLLEMAPPELFYRRLVSHWEQPANIVIGATEPESLMTGSNPKFDDLPQTMMYLDTLTELPDDILTKVDRASMAVSLEAREPFLDHRVVELAWRLPVAAKIREGTGKWALRQVLYRHVPRALIDRRKMGFRVPIAAWLRESFRDWAEDLLDDRRLREDGFFNPAPIREKWEEHIRGERQWHPHLWDVLMFQAWWRMQNQHVADGTHDAEQHTKISASRM